ncbi:MAG TPA: DNA polymerase Y family protein [Hyphomicrobiaceae bacterium]|nr:DNA polymerase Y family protein [Hyphomicrobiaceae bacterium]
MSRIVSVWLKSWPIARLLRAQTQGAAGSPAEAVDPGRPLALVAAGQGGVRLVAVNSAARRSGLTAGELLANARSKVRNLQVRDADPAADSAALRKLGFWCLRYTPTVMACGGESGADGLFLDITGAAHLFGGEAALLADLAGRLRAFGLIPRLAVAGTAGAAWAVARFGERECAIVPSGGEEEALRDLPLAGLRLSAQTQLLLRRLGFRRIGDLLRQPRAPLAGRFGEDLLLRLDQALGRAPEPLSPLVSPPAYRAHVVFAEPIGSEAHVIEGARRLLVELSEDLDRNGAGARKLRLLLFRLDGKVLSLTIGLAAPSRDVAHMTGLIALRLDRLPNGLEADFGFDAMSLHVLLAEPMAERQALFAVDDEAAVAAGLARLIDRLEQRLGRAAVRRLHPRQSHIPERAVILKPAGDVGALPDWAAARSVGARPLLLLPRPEATEVVALVPEGPPRQFRWRGVLHQVADAEGPERIAPEWWHTSGDEAERDYYVVEDTAGRRFWLYRAGRYGAGVIPAWFVHGVFA